MKPCTFCDREINIYRISSLITGAVICMHCIERVVEAIASGICGEAEYLSWDWIEERQ